MKIIKEYYKIKKSEKRGEEEVEEEEKEEKVRE